MLKKTLLCLLLSLSLLAGPAAQAQRYPEKEHLPVDYQDMLPVTAFDDTALQSALRELEGVCGRNDPRGVNDQTRQRVQNLYDQILLELNVLITKVSLSSVQYDASGGGEAETALYLELSGQQSRLFDRCYQAFGRLAVSPYRDILDDSAGEGTARSLAGYTAMTEEDASLLDEEDQLIQSYDQIMARGVPALVDGQLWTPETLESAGLDGEVYLSVRAALEEERNRAAGELYRQLLHLRAETASQAGYDNYAEYAYWALYNRDYDLEDAKTLWAAAKDHILPLQLRLLEDIDQRDIRALEVRSRKSGEEILDSVQPFIDRFDPEMGSTFAFMRAHHLYDIERGADKLPTCYTSALPAYGSAIIFNCPYGNYQDYSDLVHEFGHFNETFHCVQHDLWADFNIDVGEIDSQALVLMFSGYAEELFGERCGKVYEQLVLCDILDSVLDGCLYDEFQAAAYADPDQSVEELNRLFKRLSEEYGYFYDPGVKEDPSWVENAHSFQSPLYYISYATSALSALDLWFLYQDSPRRGQEAYLDLTALSLSLPYREAVEAVGLRDIFDPRTIPELAGELEEYLDGKPVSYGRTSYPVLLVVMSCAAAVFILFCIAAMVRCARFLNKSNGWKSLSRSHKHLEEANGEEPWSSRREKPPWEF